jgi:hypothetical protein
MDGEGGAERTPEEAGVVDEAPAEQAAMESRSTAARSMPRRGFSPAAGRFLGRIIIAPHSDLAE